MPETQADLCEITWYHDAIEITPEMVSAGVASYEGLLGVFDDYGLVKAIYTSMALAAPVESQHFRASARQRLQKTVKE